MSCSPNCTKCYLNTQILLSDDGCSGIFTFQPDLFTCPTPENNCDLDVYVLKNCKGDYKLQLLDLNGCVLDTLVLKCTQFELVDISLNFSDVSSSILPLYPSGYNQIFQINANNLSLVGSYTSFEESAYFYRKVTQTYLNLWCGAENNGLICDILTFSHNVVQSLNGLYVPGNSDTDQYQLQAQQMYSFTNDILKLRVVGLKQLCDCGKICNDQYFFNYTNPCQALSGCCERQGYGY